MVKRYVKMDITSPIGTTFGDMVGQCLYNDSLLEEGFVKGWSGCPHNGGEHNLRLEDTKDNLLSWLELLEDTTPLMYNGKKIELKEIELLKKELDKGSTNIKLKKLL